jgi:alkanesulfonate monooxygenase SsuD/methylene tetrahydromethanopterin reductase-like flavin-dependent oxidoreductase (luciferase family)
MDEGLEVLTRAFTGERFSFHGKRYDFDDVAIRPRCREALTRRAAVPPGLHRSG